uniref:hypothetical protein n=1 Tax=Pedobacter schmidteae TaxID=2201271 RepID=UPI000EAFCE15|nr:hypothetical protein [Pedobacter schmidteae]
MTILITGGKSAAALKQANQFINDQVILADYGEMPSLSSAKYKFLSLGERNDDIIAHNLLNHCLNEGADAILTLNDYETTELLKSAVLFKEFNIDILEA